MGDSAGRQFDALWQEAVWLRSKWSEYVELFGTTPARIVLMNRAAPRFFRIVQDALWEETLLAIARLTDPPRSAGKENLTVRALPLLIENLSLGSEVHCALESAIDASTFCRDWRNRRIAHRDLRLAIDKGLAPLESATRAKVEQALKALENVLNAVARHYKCAETMFDAGSDSGGALALLRTLDDGLVADDARCERIRAGKLQPGDSRPRSI